MKQMIAGQISNDNSLWWDNIETKNKKETRSEILSNPLRRGCNFGKTIGIRFRIGLGTEYML
jgi:hypothetical protein